MFTRNMVIIGWLVIATLIVGCNLTTGETPLDVAEKPTAQTSTTTNPIPSSTPLSVAECPDVGVAKFDGNPEGFLDFENIVLKYLNAGGDPAKLPDLFLQEDNLINPSVSFIDLNGDNVNEIALMTHVKLSEPPNQEGGILVFNCSQGKYISYRVTWDYYFFEPEIYDVLDINDDGNQEIVFTYVLGQSYCGAGISIVGFNSLEIVDYFDDIKNTPDCKIVLNIVDQDQDRQMEIIVIGRTTSSLGGGPSRGLEHTYILNENKMYELRSSKLLPSDYRIHVLEDAQIAFDDSDYEKALQVYSVAAHSGQLQDVPSLYDITMKNSDPAHVQFPHEYQTAFALFRMIIIMGLLDDLDGAIEIIEEMRVLYPEDSPGSEFYILANIFTENFLLNNSELEACLVVTALITSTFPELEWYIGYWGHSNISYTNETICPFLPNESED